MTAYQLIKRIFALCLLLSATTFSFGQKKSNPDCSIVKSGSFKYLDIEDTTAYFEIDQSNHIEYHNGGKYHIKSDLKWLDDCTYSMTMVENTIPGFPYKPGDIMTVEITNVEGDIIYYTAKVKKQSWKGRMQKMK